MKEREILERAIRRIIIPKYTGLLDVRVIDTDINSDIHPDVIFVQFDTDENFKLNLSPRLSKKIRGEVRMIKDMVGMNDTVRNITFDSNREWSKFGK